MDEIFLILVIFGFAAAIIIGLAVIFSLRGKRRERELREAVDDGDDGEPYDCWQSR